MTNGLFFKSKERGCPIPPEAPHTATLTLFYGIEKKRNLRKILEEINAFEGKLIAIAIVNTDLYVIPQVNNNTLIGNRSKDQCYVLLNNIFLLIAQRFWLLLICGKFRKKGENNLNIQLNWAYRLRCREVLGSLVGSDSEYSGKHFW